MFVSFSPWQWYEQESLSEAIWFTIYQQNKLFPFYLSDDWISDNQHNFIVIEYLVTSISDTKNSENYPN